MFARHAWRGSCFDIYPEFVGLIYQAGGLEAAAPAISASDTALLLIDQQTVIIQRLLKFVPSGAFIAGSQCHNARARRRRCARDVVGDMQTN
jgi:cob(I)alamin adenosyltransferase